MDKGISGLLKLQDQQPMIALAYLICDNPIPTPIIPPLAPQPHSADHGSVEAELIAWALHTHARYYDDNSELYYDLEIIT